MTQVWQRNREIDHLHPLVREKINNVLKSLNDERLPFRVFEGCRSPQRQQYLHDQGRTRSGAIVTHALPWKSYHQYGLATDFKDRL